MTDSPKDRAEELLRLAGQAEFLRTMVAAEIARCGDRGPYESTMVRAGLLIDIIDLALLVPGLVEALEKLANEVDALCAFEPEVRAAIGNTNFSILMERRDLARNVLARAGQS